jgi:putative ABC transport system permease protein
MEILPIVSTLRRHKMAAALVILEIALTCAIVCNALFLIHDRLARMDRASGTAEDELVEVSIAGIARAADAAALTEQDLAALRAIPGVHAAASVNMAPYGNSSWNSDVSTVPHDPTGRNVALFMGKDAVETLGVRLLAGRLFQPDEYVTLDAAEGKVTHVPSIVITRSLADKLYPGGDAVGKPLYATGDDPQVVVGVIDDLLRPNDHQHPGQAFEAMVLPVKLAISESGHYLLRADPDQRDAVLATVEATLDRVDPSRVLVRKRTIEEARRDYYRQDRAMAYLLGGVSLALLLITALGVVGLASFWVQQRTRQIGIRRALGATRGDIRRYFMVENFILATAGIAIGMALAYAINLWLMAKYDVPRLPADVLPIGALLLWMLGQLAVLGPATRASLIAPAIATRSV